jgi:DNA-binding CsgD family transcriptional regulator
MSTTPQADDAEINDLIVSLYQAAEHPELWARWLDEHQDEAGQSHLLGRHVRVAQQLRRKLGALGATRAATAAILNRLPIALLLVDAHGRVLLSNTWAARLAEHGDAIAVSGHHLTAATPELTRRLQATIRSVTADGADGQKRQAEAALVVPRTNGLGPMHVLAAAITPQDDLSGVEPRAAAAVFICDPDCDLCADTDRLQRLFALTAGETRVAVGLANGSSVNDLAGKLNLSRNTVRWHVKHVLQKAGVKTQAQFVRIVHRSLAGLL